MPDWIVHVLRVLYASVTFLLALYGLSSWVLVSLYWWTRLRPRPVPARPSADMPLVTVQLPVYNEKHVVQRLIDAAANLDYPRDRLQIQVLDDSNDETTLLAEARAAFHRARGVDIAVLRRPERSGFKAGALAWGLKQARGEFIAIFDADFQPPPDFLQRTIPYLLADPKLGMVQARWSHLNADYSLLTRAQALALDGHFVVEQAARSNAGLLMHFNGTAGVWRRTAIESSGGWQTDTVCEDLDLSYRAQLAGWHCRYLPDVEGPAELPPQMLAFKQQQARWARGSLQCLRKLALPLLRSPRFNLPQKLMALIHLGSYLGHPLLVLLLLITVPLLSHPKATQGMPALLGVLCLGPFLVYITSQWATYRNWGQRLLALPLLALLGTGIAWNNALASWRGLTQWGGEFARTPKFHLEGRKGEWTHSRYRLVHDRAMVGEALLSLYALVGVAVAARMGNWGMVPFLLNYALAFGLVAGASLLEGLQRPPAHTRGARMAHPLDLYHKRRKTQRGENL